MGSAIPLRVNPVPETAAPLTEMLEPPEFVILAPSVWLEPTCTVLKFSAEGLLINDPGVTPTAVRATLMEGLAAASLTIFTFPLALPAAVGEKETEKLWVCPAAIANGNATPLTLKPVPLAAN